MIRNVIQFSVRNKVATGIFLLVFVGLGAYSVSQLAIDALPDVTNNQVQVITNSPNLATQEVEQFVTYPIEMHMKSIPDVVELRSTSRSGLSVITIVFKDKVPQFLARQQVSEKLREAESEIPSGYGKPDLIPATTGLGEIFQYTLAPKPGFEAKFDAMELRTIQDWIIKRQLIGTPGIVDVSSFGGFLKQYEVAVAPEKLVSMSISLTEVFTALERNNQNTGGSYIDKGANIYFIRSEGLVRSLQDIEDVVVKSVGGMPVKVRDLAKVQFGSAPRYGAMTRNGNGETVGGVVLMLKGENSVKVIKNVKERMAQIEKNLPEGLTVDVFVDRTKLIDNTIGTVVKNLTEGALIVVIVLVIFLGNYRAGLIVASVIPLAMLFAISMMNVFGVSANLMSMGALDFGLIVDGAVIIVESLLHSLSDQYKNQLLSRGQMDEEVVRSSSSIMSNAVFGQLIILIVYIPIFALTGIEGKMFVPMAQTVAFAILGALLLSLTYVPLMASLFLDKNISSRISISDRVMSWITSRYTPLLRRVLRHRVLVACISIVVFMSSIFLFSRLGGEFIPELDEGDIALNYTIRQGSNLHQSIITGTQLEKILLQNFPEVTEAVSKIGSSEIPTDPMPIESADLIIVMKDKSEWRHGITSEGLSAKMNEKLSVIPGVNLSFEQPIQMRFNELIAGVKSDIAIKIYGENLDMLFEKGNEVSKIIAGIPGLFDVKVEQVVGMPQLVVKFNRARIAQYNLNIEDVNRILSAGLAGGKAGLVYEGERKFDLVVRFANYRDAEVDKLKSIFIPLPDGTQIPISQIADVSFQSAPAQISRENAERRIVVEGNVRGRDIQSVVEDIQRKLEVELKLPSGYYLNFGGTFKNLQEAKGRLLVAVPVALILILLLLFFSFRSVAEGLIIFSAIPLAAVGGVVSLWLRDMNFSISAGIGFIALFGVAVLNGIVLISALNKLRDEGEEDLDSRILKGTALRLRPVLATAAVASLGFLPMALSTSAGSEIQKPLATVVIGGLISSTLLTLFVLPVLYRMFKIGTRKSSKSPPAIPFLFISFILFGSNSVLDSQTNSSVQEIRNPSVEMDSCVALALRSHPMIRSGEFALRQQQALKSGFTLDPLTLKYDRGQINGLQSDYNFSVTTGMRFPTELSATAELQNRKIALAEQQLTVTRIELVKNVRAAYVQLLFGLQRRRVLNELDSIYTNFASFAEKKYSLGESGKLERVAATAQMREVQMKKQEAESNLLVYKSELYQWMGIDHPIAQPSDSIVILPFPRQLDTVFLNGNPLLSMYQRQLNVSLSEYELEKSKWAPSLQFGYFNQSIDLTNNFQGASIGITIPFLLTGHFSRVESFLLGVKVAENESEIAKLKYDYQYLKALQHAKQFTQSYLYYQREGMTLSETLTNVAEKSFRSGEINYVEYVQNINAGFQIRLNYLQTVLDYNLAILQLMYLNNQ